MLAKVLDNDYSIRHSPRATPYKLFAFTFRQLTLPQVLSLGRPVRFVYTSGIPRAIAWDLPDPFNLDRVNIPHYSKLLGRAVDTILEPIVERFGVGLNKIDQLTLDL